MHAAATDRFRLDQPSSRRIGKSTFAGPFAIRFKRLRLGTGRESAEYEQIRAVRGSSRRQFLIIILRRG